MHKLSDLLPLTIKKLGIAKRYNAESAIFHWREIVGDKIATHAYPVSVQRDVLLVAVGNPVWGHHLSMMKQDIITKLNCFIGDNLIRDIRFQAGYLKNNHYKENTGQEHKNEIKLYDTRLEDSEIKAVNNIVAEIKDNELRKKLAYVVKKDFALKKLRQNSKWHKCSCCSALCPPEYNLCITCKLKEKEQTRSAIYKTLIENPWLGYSELKNYVPASFEEFKEVKERLIVRLSTEITGENNDKIKELTLVMLATGIKPEQITDALVNNTLKRFRRNKHVSAFRG